METIPKAGMSEPARLPLSREPFQHLLVQLRDHLWVSRDRRPALAVLLDLHTLPGELVRKALLGHAKEVRQQVNSKHFRHWFS